LEQALPPIPLQANISKASFCHIERRKANTCREETEGAIKAVLADGGVGGGAYSFDLKKCGLTLRILHISTLPPPVLCFEEK